MNTLNLVQVIANMNNYTQEAAGRIVNTFIRATGKALSARTEVSLIAFGNFSVSTIYERKRINLKAFIHKGYNCFRHYIKSLLTFYLASG